MYTSNQEIDAAVKLLSDDFAMNIYKCYGIEISACFKSVLQGIPHILKNLDLNKYKSIRILKCDLEDIDNISLLTNITNYSHLSNFIKPYMLIYIVNTSNIYIYSSDDLYDINNLLEKTFVYEYHNCQDIFHTKENSYIIPNLSGGESVFTISTYKDLDEALMQYKTAVVDCVTCPFIQNSIFDPNRIFFKRKPEHYLRDSLNYYLNARLRGDNIEIRPEQIIDTSHPVDIKITWGNTNHLALIEIKWLGQSINEETLDLTTGYTESRARDGAKQLADYLDGNKLQVPNHNTKGYLVVYDLRRKNINKDTRCINKENGLYYRDMDISYAPNYEAIRDDFHKPFRFFIEPRCEDAS